VTAAEREALILSLEPQVRRHARRKHAAIHGLIGLDELVSAAWVGAIAAVDRFDEKRGLKLNTFADWKILGALGDYLRSLDHLSRDHRSEVTRGNASEPISFSIDQAGTSEDSRSLADQSRDHRAFMADPHSITESARIDARLTLRAIYRRAQLRPRNARILKLWMEGEGLKTLAHSHGINESRASQICSRAIRKLRAAA
jgi:RNA polymerase sigma factor (sigma-70 family)